jgi:hypothetical protein
MIVPTIGRVVLIHNRDVTPKSSQPEPALITFVHSDRSINVGGFNAHGQPFHATTIPLLQDSDAAPAGVHAEWMPYQKQVAKGEIEPVRHAVPTKGTIAATQSTEPSPLSAAAEPVPDVE